MFGAIGFIFIIAIFNPFTNWPIIKLSTWKYRSVKTKIRQWDSVNKQAHSEAKTIHLNNFYLALLHGLNTEAGYNAQK